MKKKRKFQKQLKSTILPTKVKGCKDTLTKEKQKKVTILYNKAFNYGFDMKSWTVNNL